MPAACCVAFVAIPIIAALALEIDAFVPLMVLFCVMAGLTASSVASSAEDVAGADNAGLDRECHRPQTGLRSGRHFPASRQHRLCRCHRAS